MDAEASGTGDLLRRWHDGDDAALDELLRRDLGWVEARVRRRLGGLLRDKAETQDYVQDAIVEFLRYGPRFVTEDRGRFRALLAQIVENVLRDRNDWFRAKRRAASRERALPSSMLLDLDLDSRAATRPSEHAIRGEREEWTRLALELLAPDDRRIIVLRHWDGMSFPEIGAELGLSEDAVRMRFHRALPKLARRLVELRGTESSVDVG